MVAFGVLFNAASADEADKDFMALYSAVCDGDLKEARRLINDEVDVNKHEYGSLSCLLGRLCSDEYGCRYGQASSNALLHLAAIRGDLKMAILLLNNGADINATNGWGWTPLAEAEFNGHQEMVDLLLRRGADANLSGGRPYGRDGNLPLIEAASYPWDTSAEGITSILLKYGADSDVSSLDGKTPLVNAVHNSQLGAVEQLLEYGADPNIANRWSEKPLFWAVAFGDLEMTTLLLKYGADPRITYEDGETLVERAEREGNLEIVKVLLDFAAQMDESNMATGLSSL